MQAFGPYRIIEKLDESRNSVVYRGCREDSSDTVVIKSLRVARPSAAAVARFRREYELLRHVELPGVVRYLDLVEEDERIAFIMEDFRGVSLRREMGRRPLGLDVFLDIALQLARTLGELHCRNIVHRDIKPDNIIRNAGMGIAKITDFGIAAELAVGGGDVHSPEVLEGTLLYMSPEQTGRMNRSVDYRTDLYSLGVTFYEMLTGDVPFRSNDPLEIVHSHIARQPVPPRDQADAVPAVLSAIVMKLLAKTAEERYQNGFGLAADLEECRRRFDASGTIDGFPVGAKDIPLRFTVPQTLVGREAPVALLLNAFERAAAGGRECVLVTGQPGIGKSALIDEIRKPIMARRGYCIAGKYDQYRRDIPYSAIIEAFRGLVKQLLSESEEHGAQRREELRASLGPNGKVLTDVLPEMEFLIGKQPPVPEMGPEERQNRFNLVFRSMVEVFARREHPLVVFLDDMQWADAASIKLVRAILEDADLRSLCVIMAYREREVDEAHPLTAALEALEKTGMPPLRIAVGPLTTPQVNSFLARFLRHEEPACRRLAELVHGKTGGNPFFINQFLKALHDGGCLELDPALGWRWDLERIGAMTVTDNVVELMAGKIAGLRAGTRRVLTACACIGNRFDLETLAYVLERPLGEILEDLADAIGEGLLFRAGELYGFQHDRIMEAADSLLGAAERQRLHLRIGIYLEQAAGPDELDEKILYVVDHLNAAIGLLAGTPEALRLASMNLAAIRKARSSNAHETALKLANTALSLLPADPWRTFAETYGLHVELAEAQYLNGLHDEAERTFATLLAHSRTPYERALVHDRRAVLLMSQWKMEECADCVRAGLRELGMRVPRRPGKAAIVRESWRERRARPCAVTAMVDLPEVAGKETGLRMNLQVNLILSTFFFDLELSGYSVVRMVRETYRYGISEHASYAYSVYGYMLGSLFGDFDTGRDFAETALAMARKFDNPGMKAKTFGMWGGLVNHWRAHVRSNIEPLIEGYRNALESGDAHFLGFISGYIVFALFGAATDLGEVAAWCGKLARALRNAHNPAETVIYTTLGAIGHLRDAAVPPFSFASLAYTEEELERFDNSSMQCWYSLVKARVHYLYGSNAEAFRFIGRARRYLAGLIPNVPAADYFLFYILIAAAIFPEKGERERRALLKQMRHYRGRFVKWARGCPENYEHQLHLVSAEIARVEGEEYRALELYDLAIAGAHRGGFSHHEALACECAARLLHARGRDPIAQAYAVAGVRLYQRWGAGAKARHLAQEYEVPLADGGDPRGDGTSHAGYGSTGTTLLDLDSIIRTSQTLSSEINPDVLLESIMQYSIENAGAEQGYLVLEKEEDRRLYIEAAGSVAGGISTPRAIELSECGDLLPRSVINYVNRTGEDVVLADAAADERFLMDPYIVRHRTKSVLCSPIRHQGRMLGMLYLENNLSTDAFTEARLQVLRIFSAQAAISLVNARLLEQRERAARLQTEMSIAAAIQKSLLPETPAIPGYEIVAYMRPAEEVGGDYYDVVNTDAADWLVIGDVSGHGVPAGLVMMMVQTAIQTLLREFPEIDPARLLSIINRAISYNVGKMTLNKYMTITAFRFGRDGRIFHSGLHLNILLFHAGKNEVEAVPTTGIWLSPWEFLDHDATSNDLALERGDMMLLFTDGITEAEDTQGRLFSEPRLKGLLLESAAGGPAAVRDAVLGALESYNTRDDITMVLVQKG